MKITIERADKSKITYETENDDMNLETMVGIFDDLLHSLSYHYEGYLGLKDFRKDLI